MRHCHRVWTQTQKECLWEDLQVWRKLCDKRERVSYLTRGDLIGALRKKKALSHGEPL
jgi:hypothetical protein